MDATEQAALVASGAASPLELLDAAIERIERIDSHLNAVNIPWFERARAAASSGELPDGPFRGVPFLLKDLGLHVAGEVLTHGNRALAREMPISDHDADLVGRYRAAGLVFAGRSASAEFGSLPVTETDAFGATRNPWDLDRTPGGSSGGSGAAVAAGLVPIAHGSDGGGSIRIPASCCGLVGLKPSQGRITMAPDRAETIFAVDHVLTRSVRDTAAMLDATAGPGVGDIVRAPSLNRPLLQECGRNPGRLRIGLLDHRPRSAEALDPPVVEAVRAAASMLEGLGHAVEPGHPSALADPDVPAAFGIVRSPEMAVMLRSIEATIGRPIEPDEVQSFNTAQAEYGRAMTAVDLVDGMATALRFRREVQQWWTEGWDLLLTPTLAELPLPIGTLDPDPEDPMACLYRAGEFVPFTPPFNISGQPAISLPLHRTAEGVPVGVQLVAAWGREDLLIQVAAQLEAAHPWAGRRPPV